MQRDMECSLSSLMFLQREIAKSCSHFIIMFTKNILKVFHTLYMYNLTQIDLDKKNFKGVK